ncbi:MAG: alpha/beta fold hydrolase [Desulfofustis sp.]|nr:alpha/beta fold hydrolase [Desulfofustis sp.]
MIQRIFLHGLDSSGRGTKGTYFSTRYPDMLRPDFEGTLQQRLSQLHNLLANDQRFIVVGSSFGGLMGACLAMDKPQNVHRLIMLAPALNFHEFQVPAQKIETEAVLIIIKNDVVTPPDIFVPAAQTTFSDLQVSIVDDDHLLHQTFFSLDWDYLLWRE